jgi:hypothetical protein
MDRDTIERWQAAKVNKVLYPKRNYLLRFKERMQKAGFQPSDPLFLLVEKAYDAMRRLHVDTHHLSCSGVGRPSQQPGAPDDRPVPE